MLPTANAFGGGVTNTAGASFWYNKIHGVTLQVLREEHGYSRRSLGELLNVDKFDNYEAKLNVIESGRSKPTVTDIEKILAALGIDFSVVQNRSVELQESNTAWIAVSRYGKLLTQLGYACNQVQACIHPKLVRQHVEAMQKTVAAAVDECKDSVELKKLQELLTFLLDADLYTGPVGTLLHKSRVSLLLLRSELATEIGVSVEVVEKWETKTDYQPILGYWPRLLEALDVSDSAALKALLAAFGSNLDQVAVVHAWMQINGYSAKNLAANASVNSIGNKNTVMQGLNKKRLLPDHVLRFVLNEMTTAGIDNSILALLGVVSEPVISQEQRELSTCLNKWLDAPGTSQTKLALALTEKTGQTVTQQMVSEYLRLKPSTSVTPSLPEVLEAARTLSKYDNTDRTAIYFMVVVIGGTWQLVLKAGKTMQPKGVRVHNAKYGLSSDAELLFWLQGPATLSNALATTLESLFITSIKLTAGTDTCLVARDEGLNHGYTECTYVTTTTALDVLSSAISLATDLTSANESNSEARGYIESLRTDFELRRTEISKICENLGYVLEGKKSGVSKAFTNEDLDKLVNPVKHLRTRGTTTIKKVHHF